MSSLPASRWEADVFIKLSVSGTSVPPIHAHADDQVVAPTTTPGKRPQIPSRGDTTHTPNVIKIHETLSFLALFLKIDEPPRSATVVTPQHAMHSFFLLRRLPDLTIELDDPSEITGTCGTERKTIMPSCAHGCQSFCPRCPA